MNKYKVEFTQTRTYIVDVLADSEFEAKDKAQNKWEIIKINNMEHYHEFGDPDEKITTVYDVTGTDDPFNPEN